MSIMMPTTLITGPAGQLELAMSTIVPEENMPIGVICHPHPLQGGTMTNKVVTTIARAWRDQGTYPILFNYRGVGNSAGHYGDAIGETQDTIAVINWAQQQWPNRPLWLAGFSFGAYVSLSAAQQYPQLQRLITIAPAVNHQPYINLRVKCPWRIIMALQDAVVPLTIIKSWLTTLKPMPDVVELPMASHFFDGQLLALREAIMRPLSLC